MSRSLFLLFVLTIGPLSAGCNNTSQSAEKVDAAQNDATKKVTSAGDFATAQQDYRHWVQVNLDVLTKELDDLDAKASSADNTAHVDLAATVRKLRAQRAAFVADAKSIESATVDTWDETKTRLDKEWIELKTAADKAA